MSATHIDRSRLESSVILVSLLNEYPGSNLSKTGEARLFAGRDPREQGGKLNSPSQADVVEVVCLGGKEYLWYKAPRIDVAILRGSTADTDGNVSFERECFYADALNQASLCRPIETCLKINL